MNTERPWFDALYLLTPSGQIPKKAFNVEDEQNGYVKHGSTRLA